jgi:hypothetical protein
LQGLQERYSARGLATLSLSLDHDSTAWQTALKRLALLWPQGRAAAVDDAGVSSMSCNWLLNPPGKIIAKVYEVEELDTSFANRMK